MSVQAVANTPYQSPSPSFWQRYQTVLKKWGGREVVASVGTQLAQDLGLEKPASRAVASQALLPKSTAARIQAQSASYGELLNIGNKGVHAQDWLEPDIRAAVRAANWQNPFKPNEATRGLPVLDYLKKHPKEFIQRRINGNLAPTTTALATGQNLFAGAMNALGLGMLGFTILDNTAKGYRYAKSQEDGSAQSKVQTMVSTAGTFAGQAFKNIARWEMGCLGYSVARGALGIKGLPGTLAGVALGGVGSSLAYVGLSQVIQNPPEPLKKV